MKATADIDEEERTNAVGLFNTARSYWRSAEHLNAAGLKVTHPQAPVTFLFCHAIELYLKAFLRGSGSNLATFKRIGHRVSDLARAATESGLALDQEYAEVLTHIDTEDVAIEARYIVTGFAQKPTADALSGASQALDTAVCAKLSKLGFAVRAERFDRPPPQSQQLVAEVEEHISQMTTKDREILGYLLHRNQRMFTGAIDGGHAQLLIARGIVRTALRGGQVFDAEDVPYQIPQPIWNILLLHKREFPRGKDSPHPWRVGWMER